MSREFVKPSRKTLYTYNYTHGDHVHTYTIMMYDKFDEFILYKEINSLLQICHFDIFCSALTDLPAAALFRRTT